MREFTHFDAEGKAIMVDVTEKRETHREAIAKGYIRVSPEVMQAVAHGAAEKGDVLGVARIAGIMGVKRTSDLIPLCHPLPIGKTTVDFVVNEDECIIEAVCTAKVAGQTGVEMKWKR